MNTPQSSPPGWYSDPERPGWLRAWDGARWTDHWVQVQHWPADPQVAPTPSRQSPELSRWSGQQHPTSPPVQRHVRRRSRSGLLVALGLVVLVAAAGTAVWTLALRDDSNAGSAVPEVRPPGESSDDRTGGSHSDEVPRGDRLIDTCSDSEWLAIPGTEISIEPMTAEQEIEIGNQVVAEVLASLSPADDDDAQEMLDRLLDEMRPDTGPIAYSVTLLESDEVNAFAVPGGSLFFTTAIVDLMSEDELSFVMGHEIAHVHCRHIAQEIERVALVAAAADALTGAEIDVDDIYSNAAASIVTDLAGLAFSRSDEREADIASLDFMDAADRQLGAALDAMQIFLDLEGGAEPGTFEEWLSTHPPTQERLDDIADSIESR